MLASGDYAGGADLKAQLASAGRGRRRSGQRCGDRRRPSHGARARRDRRQRRHRARPDHALRSAGARELHPAAAAREARRAADRVVDERAAAVDPAAVPDELSHDRARARRPTSSRKARSSSTTAASASPTSSAQPAHAVAKQPERIAYIVFDDALAEKFEAWPYFVSTAPGVAYAYLKDYRRNRRDIYHQADTLAGLAASMRVPRRGAGGDARALQRRRARRSGPRSRASRITRSGPVKSYVVFTDGGLKVSERLEVLRADGSVDPRSLRGGLRRAGRAAARRPRPPPRLGFHLRAHRRPQRGFDVR